MRDANDALAVLSEASGLKNLKFSGSGHLELVFDGKTSIVIVRIDDDTIEFVSYLDIPGFEVEAIPLRALLHANHLGDATGGGRLALDPADDAPLFCERVKVTEIDHSALERRLLDFLKHLAFWQSREGAALLRPAGDAPRTIGPDSGEVMIKL